MREKDEDSDEEETEEITFKHGCNECGHVIGEHFYREITSANGDTRYLMDCTLCGKGAQEKKATEPDSTLSSRKGGEEGGGGGGGSDDEDDEPRSLFSERGDGVAQDAMFDAVKNQVCC